MNKQSEEQRKLTAAEQRRKARLEQLEAELYAQGYQKHDLTIGLVYANVMALVLGLPIIVLLCVAFFVRNTAGTIVMSTGNMLIWSLVLVAMIVVHELIHGVTWAIFAPHHWNSVEFGFIVKYLTPYCTCGEPLARHQYVIGALMPTLLLGVAPAVFAIFSGNLDWLLMGCVMVLGGGGDLTIVLKLLRYRGGADTVYIDHPYAAGVIAFER